MLLVAKRSRAAAELASLLTAQGLRVTFVWESAHAQVEIRARTYDCVLVERDAFPDTANVIRALRAGNAVPIVLVAGGDFRALRRQRTRQVTLAPTRST